MTSVPSVLPEVEEEKPTHVVEEGNAYKYKCKNCDTKFLHKSKYQRHIFVYTGVKPYKCSECDYSTTHSKRLREHRRIHTGEQLYKCTECNYEASRAWDVKKHKRNFHAVDKPYSCTICDYATSVARCLKKHMKSHDLQESQEHIECSSEIVLDQHNSKTHTAETDVLDQHNSKTHTAENPSKCRQNYRLLGCCRSTATGHGSGKLNYLLYCHVDDNG